MSASRVRSLTFPIHGIIRIAIVGGGRRWNSRTIYTFTLRCLSSGLNRRRKWINVDLFKRMFSSASPFGISFQSALADHTSWTFCVLLICPIGKLLQAFCIRKRLLNISVWYMNKASVPFFESRHLVELLRRQLFWFETKKIWVLTHKCKRFWFVHLSLDQRE